MTMTPSVRKLALSAHLALSVGWIGAVVAYLALDIAAAASKDAQTLRSAYLGMDLIVGSVIVPLAVASLLTGLVMSLGTRWGLFRHWWVLISLLLTLFSTIVLVVETGTIRSFAAVAVDPTASSDDLRGLGSTLVHSVGGAVVLLVILVLNVYKPRGLTPYGWRKERAERRAADLVPGAGDRGAGMTRTVELLWFSDCPHHEAARQLLGDVLTDVAPGSHIRDIDATDPTLAARLRFPGSPTIRVDGRDIDPDFIDPGDYTPRCRLYRTSDGLRGLPERRWIEDALRLA